MNTFDEFRKQLRHSAHRQLLAYWCGKAPPNGLPSRADIDPVDIPQLLPRLALIDVLREPAGLHFRYRLAGTEIVERAGRDPTGKRFDELYSGDYLRQALSVYTEVVTSGRPYASHRSFPVDFNREFISYDRLILPLAGDHVTVDMLILCTIFLDPPS